MKVIHVSAECYPIAKVGGLADVVGGLSTFQNKSGMEASVIMPYYLNDFTKKKSFKKIYASTLQLEGNQYDYQIVKLSKKKQPFPLYLVEIPDLLTTEYVYSHNDTDRFLAFQIAVLDWLISLDEKPDVVHCHDHHTGLVPFMMGNCYQYESLKDIPTVFTIHNAQYQGWFSHEHVGKIPAFDFLKVGLLDWNSEINPLAAAIKCAHRVTTVSPTYMEELKHNANGLEALFNYEAGKCSGILNGIDTKVWNTEKDDYLVQNFTISKVQSGKKANKKYICKEYGFDIEKPLVVFIGRFVYQKAAELLPDIAHFCLQDNNVSLLILGSGEHETENRINAVNDVYTNTCGVYIGYNEELAHRAYAAADFLLMPSRFEPCGLNQLYALKYGTLPIVTRTGGLNDTVTDVSEEDGFGFCFDHVTVEEVSNAVKRAVNFYENKAKEFRAIRKKIMKKDHSWEASANEYTKLYNSIL